MTEKLREKIAEKLVKHNIRPQKLKQKFSDMPVGVRGYYLEEADFVLSLLLKEVEGVENPLPSNIIFAAGFDRAIEAVKKILRKV